MPETNEPAGDTQLSREEIEVARQILDDNVFVDVFGPMQEADTLPEAGAPETDGASADAQSTDSPSASEDADPPHVGSCTPTSTARSESASTPETLVEDEDRGCAGKTSDERAEKRAVQNKDQHDQEQEDGTASVPRVDAEPPQAEEKNASTEAVEQCLASSSEIATGSEKTSTHLLEDKVFIPHSAHRATTTLFGAIVHDVRVANASVHLDGATQTTVAHDPPPATITATTGAQTAHPPTPAAPAASGVAASVPDQAVPSGPGAVCAAPTKSLKRKSSASADKAMTTQRRKTKKGKAEDVAEGDANAPAQEMPYEKAKPWRTGQSKFRYAKLPRDGSGANMRVAGDNQHNAEHYKGEFKQFPTPGSSGQAHTVPSQAPLSGGESQGRPDFVPSQGYGIPTPAFHRRSQHQQIQMQYPSGVTTTPADSTYLAGPVYTTPAHPAANVGPQGHMPYPGVQTHGGAFGGSAIGANVSNFGYGETSNPGMPADYHNGGGYNGVGQFTPYNHDAHGYNAQASGAAQDSFPYPVDTMTQPFASAPLAPAPSSYQQQAPGVSFNFGSSTYSTTSSSSTVAPSFSAPPSSGSPSSSNAQPHYDTSTPYGVYGNGRW
ncbi:hypothetical protein BD626DRAFT_632285 [Schizophyllum amplum]|uniref:Uncharacterized protein n=1 Tax=Schizophyllum amplum TaxID=97359 RepID=A0A550C7T4_9AGAR|nr:hypothetical protein BD626DRAFT_632285 [Auriculariopsis ampla]